jgi:hypothetical protein
MEVALNRFIADMVLDCRVLHSASFFLFSSKISLRLRLLADWRVWAIPYVKAMGGGKMQDYYEKPEHVQGTWR